jgi:hypothetical protein
MGPFFAYSIVGCRSAASASPNIIILAQFSDCLPRDRALFGAVGPSLTASTPILPVTAGRSAIQTICSFRYHTTVCTITWITFEQAGDDQGL